MSADLLCSPLTYLLGEVCGATYPSSLVAGLRQEVADMLEMTEHSDQVMIMMMMMMLIIMMIVMMMMMMVIIKMMTRGVLSG